MIQRFIDSLENYKTKSIYPVVKLLFHLKLNLTLTINFLAVEEIKQMVLVKEFAALYGRFVAKMDNFVRKTLKFGNIMFLIMQLSLL